MSDLTITIPQNGTDHTINIDDTADNHITHTGHVHYNDEFNVYAIISYKTQGGNVLNTTVHQIGTKPTIERIPLDAFNLDKIRERVETELNYTLTDDQLTDIAETVRDAGQKMIHQWGLYDDELYRHIDSDGYIDTQDETPLEGWDYVLRSMLDDLDYHPDDEQDIIRTVSEAFRDYTPGEHGHVAQLQCGDTNAWQLRALELYQNSVLANKPQLCKVQALRENDYSPTEISNTLDTHRSTVSHQLNTIDTWLNAADWTTQNITND
jgi:hypothetical protein